MRKIFYLFLFISTVSTNLLASHYMGGEIMWECLPNGNYRFILHVYRECGGCNVCFATNDKLETNVPGFSTNGISISLYPNYAAGRKDMSPQCNTNALFPHIKCFPTPSIVNTGAIEEFTYTTDINYPDGVDLPAGPIPAGGWYFAFTNCCRNPCTNYTGSSSKDWWLRAVMYPYPWQDPDFCFDNSPFFGEKPTTVLCTGYPYVYNPVGMDNESDSLDFSWSPPKQNATLSLPGINPGFSYSSPLPGTMQNPANVPATVNPLTGEISFTSFTSGSFMTCYRVTAYKCGIKVAEIFREHQVILTNCPLPLNSPPVVQAPFQNPSTGLFTEYTDTVHAGFALDFDITASDPQTNVDSVTLQKISYSALGTQFGSGFSNVGSGCLQPPCATLSPVPPSTTTVLSIMHFHWQTDNVHLLPYNPCDGPFLYRAYDFIFKFSDDFCPVPASIYTRIRIVVQDPQTPPVSAGFISGPDLICPNGGPYIYSVSPISGATHYNWTLPPGYIGNSDSNSIVVYTNHALSNNIYVYGTNAFGSGAASGKNISLIPNIPNIIPMPDLNILPGSFAVLTASATLGTPPYTYTWNNGLAGSPVAVSPSATTEFIVTITESGGCWQTDTVKVIVSGNGNVSKFAIATDTVCAGLLRIPLYFSDFQDVDSLALSFTYPKNVLIFLGTDSIHPYFNNNNLVVTSQDGHVLIRWHSATAVNFATFIKVFNLKFQYQSGNAGLQWDVTQNSACEIYNSSNQLCTMGYSDGAVVNGSCAMLSGDFRYANSFLSPMRNVNIRLIKNGEMISETTTDPNGHFLYQNLPKGMLTLQIHCLKPWGGVNAADALAILKHSTGITILTGFPSQAADVNLSNGINSLDALLVARRFTGMISAFPKEDWIYWNNSIQVTNSSTYTISPRALCAGDVNGSYIP